MKKKLLIVTILVLAVCCLTLTACDGGVMADYSGTSTIEITLDKVYNGLEISCPSAEITKISDTRYSLVINSTAPVEVIVSAENKEQVVLNITNSELKMGTVKKDVSLSTAKYRVDFMLSFNKKEGEKLPDVRVENNNNITVENENGKYTLVSDSKITEDVILAFDNTCYNAIIPKTDIVYSLGTFGKIKYEIKVLNKNEKKAVVVSDEELKLESITNRKVYDVQKKSIEAIPFDDYVAYIGSDNYWKKLKVIKRQELEDNPYYYIKINTLSIDCNNTYYRDIYGNNVYSFEKYDYSNGNRSAKLASLAPFEVGQILYKESGWDYNGKQIIRAYKITEEDINTGVLHFTDDAGTEIRNSSIQKKIQFTYTDIYGNSIEISEAKLQFNNTETVITNNQLYWVYPEYIDANIVATDKNGITYYAYINTSLINAEIILADKNTEVVNVSVVLEEKKNKRVRFIDDATKNEVYSYNMLLAEGDYIRCNIDGSYSCTDIRCYDNKNDQSGLGRDKTILVSKELLDSDVIDIKIEKYKSISINVQNLDILPNENDIRFENDRFEWICLSKYSDSAGSIPIINIVESNIGDSFEFATSYGEFYGSIEKYTFVVTITQQVWDEGSVNVSIVAHNNEWEELDKEFGGNHDMR